MERDQLIQELQNQINHLSQNIIDDFIRITQLEYEMKEFKRQEEIRIKRQTQIDELLN